MDTKGGKQGVVVVVGGGGMNWEIGIDIYTLPNVKQIASGKQKHSQGDWLCAL